ncbi:hypothetical protein [Streptomyces sp. CAU 1734]|uniref:hypothetical protein n=1 Tax=Streptomyces sp. CAU 1734 TaxID=3140360 RepID=UPI003261D2F3
MRRRVFITAATGTAVAVTAPAVGAQRRVGFSDVERLRSRLTTLQLLENHQGGHTALEEGALAAAEEALTLQSQNATESVKRRLFGLAADFNTLAGWSCTDAGILDRAQTHLDRAMTLAGMARESAAQLRIWNNVALVATQRGDHGDAVIAGQAAQALTVSRRDPLFASLAHARTSVGYANVQDRQSALRSLGHAEDALARAVAAPRPGWMDFYGPGEFFGLTASVHFHLGAPAEAERAAHRSLTAIPERFRRNRAMVTARMARAQLHQGDLEQSYETANRVLDLMDGATLPTRMRTELGDYHRDLLELFPGTAQAHDWTEQVRMKWS